VSLATACSVDGLDSPGIEIATESTVSFAPTSVRAIRHEFVDGTGATSVDYSVLLVADHGDGFADSLSIQQSGAPRDGTTYDVVSLRAGPVGNSPHLAQDRVFLAGASILFRSGTGVYPEVGTTAGSLLSLNVDLTFENDAKWIANVAALLEVTTGGELPSD
jgi:hypothetical protein